MVNRRNAQRPHGGDDHRAVERRESHQPCRQQTEIIQRFEQPHNELQQQTRDQIDGSSQIIEAGIQIRGFLDCINFLLELVIDILSGVTGIQIHGNHCIGRFRAHFLLNGHDDFHRSVTGVDLLAGEETVEGGIFRNSAHI